MAFRNKAAKATKKTKLSSKGEPSTSINIDEIAKRSHDDTLRLLNRKMKDYEASVMKGERPMPKKVEPIIVTVYSQNEQVRAKLRELLKKDKVLLYDGEASYPYMCKAVCYYDLGKKLSKKF